MIMKTYRRKAGTTAARLQRVQHAIGLSNHQMAQLLQTSPKTIAKWVQSGQASFRDGQKRQLVRLNLIAVLASRVYPEDSVRQFFVTPLAEFGDKCATDLLMEGNFKSVAKVIAAEHNRQRA
jgi:hypothetical protein